MERPSPFCTTLTNLIETAKLYNEQFKIQRTPKFLNPISQPKEETEIQKMRKEKQALRR